jgi:2-iminobutanoate/2-iminopropanoate deaminase
VPKQQIRAEKGAAPAGAYSQGIRAGDFVYVSGQGPLDPATGKIVGETIEEQVQLTLENVRAVLEAAGASVSDVVKSTVHLADIGDFPRFNAVYAEFFPDPKPARTTVQSVLPGIRVEIDVVAYTGE